MQASIHEAEIRDGDYTVGKIACIRMDDVYNLTYALYSRELDRWGYIILNYDKDQDTIWQIKSDLRFWVMQNLFLEPPMIDEVARAIDEIWIDPVTRSLPE